MEEYGKEYCEKTLGRKYGNREFLNLFSAIAVKIDEMFFPKTVFDAGCAHGLLVEFLRNFGIEAYGADVSKYAISKASNRIVNYVTVSGFPEMILPGNFPEKYDVVCCIEVLEHLPEEIAEPSIGRLCSLSDVVVFSSTYDDFDSPTHLNVKSPEYWEKMFNDNGFYVDRSKDMRCISKQALVYIKKGELKNV